MRMFFEISILFGKLLMFKKKIKKKFQVKNPTKINYVHLDSTFIIFILKEFLLLIFNLKIKLESLTCFL